MAILIAVLIYIFRSQFRELLKSTPQNMVKYQGELVPINPSEAFDLESIQNANLKDLNWKQVSIKTVDNVRIIDGKWSPGFYTGPIKGTGPTVDGAANAEIHQFETKTIELSSKARVYLPQDDHQPTPILVYAAHVAKNVKNHEDTFIKIAQELKVAIVVHGENSTDWQNFGYQSQEDARNELISIGYIDLIIRNLCQAVDFQTSNFPLVLARTNMLALTLIENLLKNNQQAIGDRGLMGGSKEGHATWVAAAVDNRFKIFAPQSFHGQAAESALSFAKNSGCSSDQDSPATKTPTKLALLDWELNTQEGKSFSSISNVSNFLSQLKGDFFFLGGDVGMPGMHDGIFSTMGAEADFLKNFQTIPWRYDRWSGTEGDYDPGNPSPHSPEDLQHKILIFAQIVASTDKEQEIKNWVKIKEASALDNGQSINFRITLESDQNIKAVLVFWNQSPNREFNDRGQEEWKSIKLVRAENDKYSFMTNEPIVPDQGQQIAWYAEVQQEIDFSDQEKITRKDASPIYQLRELPEKNCESYIRPRCSLIENR